MIRKLGVTCILACLLWTAGAAQVAMACDPKLVSVRVKNAAEDQRRAGIGDTLLLEIQDLQAWRATAQEELVLYVDGVPLRKAEMQRISGSVAEFKLIRDAADKEHREAWNRLLASPTRFSMLVAIDVGPLNKPPWPLANAPAGQGICAANTVDLIVLSPMRLGCFLLAMAALIWLIARLARQSGILRDGQPEASGSFGTYSLARCQMAFWFVVVLASFLFLWIMLGTADTFNTTALGLLGISGGTGFVSILLDRGKQSAAAEAKRKALAEQAEVKSAPKAVAGFAPLQALRMQETTAVITKADDVLTTSESKDFLTDLLSDENGIALHRLQILIWTVVLGGVFAVGVYRELAMPAFSATLLALMGLSSATYVGIKNTEK